MVLLLGFYSFVVIFNFDAFWFVTESLLCQRKFLEERLVKKKIFANLILI